MSSIGNVEVKQQFDQPAPAHCKPPQEQNNDSTIQPDVAVWIDQALYPEEPKIAEDDAGHAAEQGACFPILKKIGDDSDCESDPG